MKLEIEIRLKRDGFSLELSECLDGRAFGIFGPSGCGKTTLLHCLAGLIQPESGRISLDGNVLLDTREGQCVAAHQRRLGLVFQEDRLFPHLTIHRNLRYGTPEDPGLRRWNLQDIARLFQIEHLLEKKPAELSEGERQRVALGRAILMSPRVLLLDEPLASLDAGLKGEILPFLRLVKEQVGIPMIYVSHDLSEILDLTSSLLVMEGGRILGRGALHDVLKDKRAASLLRHTGLVNILRLKFLRSMPDDNLAVYALEGDDSREESRGIYGPIVGLDAGQTVHAAIGANDIILSLGAPKGMSARNCIQGRIAEIQTDGDRALCVIEGPVRLMVEITRLSVKELRLAPGQSVYCLFKTLAMRFMERQP